MNTWDMFGEGSEKLTPHEKFKKSVKRAGYDMDAGAKRLEDLLAKQKAEREAREKQEKTNEEFTGYWKGTDKAPPGRKMVGGAAESVSEAHDEVDYDDDYQDMVRRVREKAKAADALKAQGKEPQTKFNSKTGKYYVDFGQDKEVKENAEELNVGDPVIITGNVEFEGTTGEIVEFGQDKRFVVVNLYNHGKHSFHSSDVEYNDHADLDEAGYGSNRGYTPGFASPHAPALGGRRHRDDDEGWEQERQAQSVTWYIRVNGKLIKDKMGVPYQYRGKEAAAKSAQTMMAKPFNAGKKFVLTTKPVDDHPENEAVLHTEYKRNRFSGITKRDQEQDKIANMAMSRVHDVDEDEGDPEGVPHLTKELLQHIVKQVGTEGAHAIIKSLEWGDGAAKELLKLLVKDLKQDIKQGVAEGMKDGLNEAHDAAAKEIHGNLFHDSIPPGAEKHHVSAVLKAHGLKDTDAKDVINRVRKMGYTGNRLGKPEVAEEWSQKYKKSINCSHPKGFSQRAHCAGKKKHNESHEVMEMVCEDCGMCETHGNLNEIRKGQKDSNGYTRCWPGKHAEGTKKGKNGGQVRNCVPNESLDEFAPPGGDDGNDGFSDETLKRLAAQWYQGDEDPRVERTLAAAGWEIGQDEGYDDEPGVFVVQAGDINGNSYMSWPAYELEGMNEGWKSALGGAALAGAMALGGSAHAQSGEDFLPDIVAHVTFKVNGNTVTKDINLGTSFKSPGQASAALEKMLRSKGIKFYDYSLERVSEKEYNNNYLEKTPAVDNGHSGAMDSRPYSSSGKSSDDYMTNEAVHRAAKSMMEDGYEFRIQKRK